ncbi:hypothetical protein, partial [Escherichia coli]|uniref:hypothetical protein n=2 Tax=Escherichia coli TaxID=562 RepID=UPI0039863D08
IRCYSHQLSDQNQHQLQRYAQNPPFSAPIKFNKKTDLKYPKDTLIYHNIPCSHRRRQPQHRSAP